MKSTHFIKERSPLWHDLPASYITHPTFQPCRAVPGKLCLCIHFSLLGIPLSFPHPACLLNFYAHIKTQFKSSSPSSMPSTYQPISLSVYFKSLGSTVTVTFKSKCLTDSKLMSCVSSGICLTLLPLPKMMVIIVRLLRELNDMPST